MRNLSALLGGHGGGPAGRQNSRRAARHTAWREANGCRLSELGAPRGQLPRARRDVLVELGPLNRLVEQTALMIQPAKPTLQRCPIES